MFSVAGYIVSPRNKDKLAQEFHNIFLKSNESTNMDELHMNKVKIALLSTLSTMLVAYSTSSFAITAGEFLEDSNSEEVASYLSGLADMMAYSRIADGNEDAGNCIYDWYYRTEGSIERIYGYLEKYPDTGVEAIFLVLGRRACPISEGNTTSETKDQD